MPITQDVARLAGLLFSDLFAAATERPADDTRGPDGPVVTPADPVPPAGEAGPAPDNLPPGG